MGLVPAVDLLLGAGATAMEGAGPRATPGVPAPYAEEVQSPAAVGRQVTIGRTAVVVTTTVQRLADATGPIKPSAATADVAAPQAAVRQLRPNGDTAATGEARSAHGVAQAA